MKGRSKERNENVNYKTMNIIIANQKGGVGKTTLCILLANFLTEVKKEDIVCIDFDSQGSFFYKWKEDISLYSGDHLYEVIKKNLSESETIMEELNKLNDQAYAIIDVPGVIDNDYLVPIFKSADLIICPFMYDKITFESTFVFVQVLKHLKIDAPILFIPNRLKSNVNYKLTQSVNEELILFGHILPPISDRVTLQRISVFRNSLETTSIINDIFNKIYNKYINRR